MLPKRSSRKVCVVSKEDASRYRNVDMTYVCQNKGSHTHINQSRVDREVFIGVMGYCGKHKRVAYFVDTSGLRIIAKDCPIATVQRVTNGNSPLRITKAR